MESNGKGVTRDGQALPVRTAPVIWGEPGTNGQHAFFQMLHQGQDVIPVEFIALRDGGKYLGAHHQSLVVNAIAQAQALMEGRHGEKGQSAIARATGPAASCCCSSWIRHRWAP
jgi:glucose-6-phosphate isomerase